MAGRPRTLTAKREYSRTDIARAVADAAAHAAEGERLFDLLHDIALDLANRNFDSRQDAARHLGLTSEAFGWQVLRPRTRQLGPLVEIVQKLQKSGKKT
jgi:hypothetical protein